MKMAAGGNTWSLRSYPNVGGDVPTSYWQPGDDCMPGLDGYAFDSENLCGQLKSSGPCGNSTPRQHVSWQVLDDCSGVVIRLIYDTGHGVARFSVTVPTDWVFTGLPISWSTPDSWSGEGDYDGGVVVLSACDDTFPLVPLYRVCCFQLSAVGRWGTNVKRDRTQANTDACLDDNAELRISGSGTDQCQDGSYYLFDKASGDDVIATGAHTEPFNLGLGSYSYGISDDYSTITLTVDYNFNHYSTGFPFAWQEVYDGTYTVDIPYTAGWFLVPIEFEVEGVDISNDDAPVTATLTVSVCGFDVGGNPCWGEKLVCVDLEYETSVSLNGTFAMTWDGDEYSTEWMAYDVNNDVRIRLRESDDTPGTWETWLDVLHVRTEHLDSYMIGSEEIDCDPEGTPSGGGEGTVRGEAVTATIHECEEQCLILLDLPVVTITGIVGQLFQPGTYAFTNTGIGYATDWTPVIEGGGGIRIRFKIERDEDVPECEEFDPPLATYELYGEVYDEGTEETTRFHQFRFCVDCNEVYNLFGDPMSFDWPFGETEGYPPEVTFFT